MMNIGDYDDDVVGGRWDGAYSTLLVQYLSDFWPFHFTAFFSPPPRKGGGSKGQPTGTQSIGKRVPRSLFLVLCFRTLSAKSMWTDVSVLNPAVSFDPENGILAPMAGQCFFIFKYPSPDHYPFSMDPSHFRFSVYLIVPQPFRLRFSGRIVRSLIVVHYLTLSCSSGYKREIGQLGSERKTQGSQKKSCKPPSILR